jgi:hypothetical protein
VHQHLLLSSSSVVIAASSQALAAATRSPGQGNRAPPRLHGSGRPLTPALPSCPVRAGPRTDILLHRWWWWWCDLIAAVRDTTTARMTARLAVGVSSSQATRGRGIHHHPHMRAGRKDLRRWPLPSPHGAPRLLGLNKSSQEGARKLRAACANRPGARAVDCHCWVVVRWTTTPQAGVGQVVSGRVVVGWQAADRGYRPLSVGRGAVQCPASLAAPRVPRVPTSSTRPVVTHHPRGYGCLCTLRRARPSARSSTV